MSIDLRRYQNPARTRSFAAVITDADGIKTAIATNVAAQSYTGAALNGAIANPGPALVYMRIVSVTTTASPATYNTTDPIIFTGTNQGAAARTANLLLTQAGGGETIYSVVGFDLVSQIDVPAQLGGGGQFEFGVFDILPDDPLCGVVSSVGGNVNVVYEDGRGDIIPLAAAHREALPICRIVSASTTAFPLTALFPY